jgi:predicted enzyme related to lactoylglutathione lyase
MSDPIVHFELPADDLQRAQGFYGEVFGWESRSMPGVGYVLVSTTPTDEQGSPRQSGAINGGMVARQEPITAPVLTIQVASIDQALQAVEQRGGSVARAKQAVGDMGFAAYFKDTEGNLVGLWELAHTH